MDTTIEQQAAMDEALVHHAQRLRIGRSNFLLLSDIKSKESTLQLVYDVLRICPFFKAFLVTTDVPEIYMQEFWVTATVHHHAIRFKMDNKKHIMNMESFRDMLHICLRVHGQSFAEPPFEEEILGFILFLGYSAAIRTLTDVNINKNVDYAYLMWEDFVYQVEHKNHKKSNEMYYPRFTKDDHMFSTIKLVSRHQNTQLFGALLPIELTNKEIRNFNAYKEYYTIAKGAAPPKPKASSKRTRSSSDTSITPPTAAASPRLTASAKGKQTAKAFKAKSLSALSEVAMTKAQQLKVVTKRSIQQMHISQASGSGADEGTSSIPWDKGDDGEEGDGDGDDDDDDQEVERDDDKDDEEEGGDDDQEYDDEYAKETRDEESFDPFPQTPKNSYDEGNGEEDLGLNVGGEEGHVEEDEEDKLYRDVNINQGRGVQANLEVKDSHVTLTPVNPDGQQQSSSVSSQFVTSMLNPTLDFARAVSAIPGIVQRYMNQRMNEAVKVAVQIQSDRLRDEAQRENEEFLKTAVNEQLEAKVLTRSSHSSRTSYAVAADLSEMELKKILIEKMKGNKSIQCSDEQRNLYKALVEAYKSDKIILDTYEETVTLKRRRDDDADKDEEPFAGPDRGSKRRREGKEPKSASAPTETATKSVGRSTQGSKSRQASASESALAEEPMQTTSQMEEPSHPEFDTGAEDQPIVQSSQHPEWFSQQQKPPSLDRA
uniref:Uncharacterized protein n=1 Tax=Tanacetum cinerariifolium TaxID=118510 RepID=A0A6L2N901_TANCI|nr:hypothetical protein [Tanacetum cinerariifolium]